jgi:hypothetical protein
MGLVQLAHLYLKTHIIYILELLMLKKINPFCVVLSSDICLNTSTCHCAFIYLENVLDDHDIVFFVSAGFLPSYMRGASARPFCQ